MTMLFHRARNERQRRRERLRRGCLSMLRPLPMRRPSAIRAVLTEYLKAHPATQPGARVRVARFSDTGRKVEIVGVAALVGAHRSTPKARASHRNRAWVPASHCRRRPTTKGLGVALSHR
jgi:hypothetical protein